MRGRAAAAPRAMPRALPRTGPPRGAPRRHGKPSCRSHGTTSRSFAAARTPLRLAAFCGPMNAAPNAHSAAYWLWAPAPQSHVLHRGLADARHRVLGDRIEPGARRTSLPPASLTKVPLALVALPHRAPDVRRDRAAAVRAAVAAAQWPRLLLLELADQGIEGAVEHRAISPVGSWWPSRVWRSAASRRCSAREVSWSANRSGDSGVTCRSRRALNTPRGVLIHGPEGQRIGWRGPRGMACTRSGMSGRGKSLREQLLDPSLAPVRGGRQQLVERSPVSDGAPASPPR